MTIEIKVKYFGDDRNWEDIDILTSVTLPDNFTTSEIDFFIEHSYINSDIYSIRWHREGLYQGHYVSGITLRS